MATDTGLATAGDTFIGIHNTLSGTTADSVVVESGANMLCRAEVLNRSAANTIYFTTTGVTAVAAADGTIAVLPGTSVFTMPGSHHTLSIVGNSDAYSVHRWPHGSM